LDKAEQPINVVAETSVLETVKEEVKSAETFAAAERGEKYVFQTQADAPPCHECGSLMVRSGSCYKCTQCGSTSGCS
jgi:ribonucleoside-diphosphate reductase alpha chain